MEQELPEEERQRFFDSTQRSFRLASDGEILGMLESPPPPMTQGDVADFAASVSRGGLVLRALERGVLSPDTQCGKGTVVHIAALHGPLALLKLLIIERGVDPNEADTDGWRPLPLAIDGGREGGVSFLINEAPGVDIDAPIAMGGTPLMLAAKHGMVGVLRALVAKCANVNAKSKAGSTALEIAIRHGQEKAALYLVEKAAVAVYDPDAPMSALSLAADLFRRRLMRAIVRRMRADGVDSATVAAEMGGAALCAIEKGVESLEAPLEEGLDVDEAPVVIRHGESYKCLLFHHACIYGNREAAALLVERGCDPLARNARGDRVHHVLAANKDCLPMLQWLMASLPIPLDD